MLFLILLLITVMLKYAVININIMETRRHFERDKRKTRITHYNVHLEFRQSIRIINIIYRFYIGIYYIYV